MGWLREGATVFAAGFLVAGFSLAGEAGGAVLMRGSSGIQQTVPDDLDMSETMPSKSGDFNLSYQVRGGKIEAKKLEDWSFTLTTEGGEPVAGAGITVQGLMPSHEHGLKTEPRMTMALDDKGIYIVEGMMFQMPGWWKVRCSIHVGTVTDEVVFNVIVGG